MAPVAHLYRLVWGGRLYALESWSCSLNIGSDAGVNMAASTFQAALIAWMTRATSKISTAAKLDLIKFNEINPVTARYLLPTSNEVIQNDLAVGATATWPGQNTLCVSTRTALMRGRAHAGRFYPPTGALAMDPNAGSIDDVTVDAAATSAATLITAINTALGAGSRVVVFSKVAQTVEPVTSVRVGHVVDTMRSRRRSIPELWVQKPV